MRRPLGGMARDMIRVAAGKTLTAPLYSLLSRTSSRLLRLLSLPDRFGTDDAHLRYTRHAIDNAREDASCYKAVPSAANSQRQASRWADAIVSPLTTTEPAEVIAQYLRVSARHLTTMATCYSLDSASHLEG